MSFFDWGTPPINSTGGQQNNASTATMLAELDSSNGLSSRGGVYNVNIWIGCDTLVTMVLENCLSTGLASTAVIESHLLRVVGGQTSQFVRKMVLEGVNSSSPQGGRFRVRPQATISGLAEVKLQAEEIR